MRNMIIAGALVSLVALDAHAISLGSGNNNNNNNTNTNTNTNVNAAAAAAIAASSSRASARQHQSQSQHQSLSNRNTVKQRNSQANQQIHNEYEQRPSGIAPSIGLGGFASGPCVGTTTQAGFGVGLPGGASFGAGGGRSEIDDECTRRETARILDMLGQRALAVQLMMASPTVRAIIPPVPAAAPAPTQLTTTPVAVPSSDKHPACAPSSWASREWRTANCQ